MPFVSYTTVVHDLFEEVGKFITFLGIFKEN
jgi:hypothetical protein